MPPLPRPRTSRRMPSTTLWSGNYIELADPYQNNSLGVIERYAEEAAATEWLKAYLNVLQGKGPRFTFDSEVQSRLHIIGLVRVAESGHLVPRNRIFERVFDEGWVHPRS